MSLRVLHVYKDVHPDVPGGIERHIDDLRRHVPGVAGSVLICSRRRRTSIRSVEHGVEVAVGELGRALSAPLAPTFPLWLRRIPTDVVHLHLPNPTGEVATLLMPPGVPIVASYHADIVRQAALLPVYQPVVDRVLRRARAIVCGTHALAVGSPLLGAHRHRIQVIPYGVDLRRFSPEAADAEAVAELRRRFRPPLVVATGRLVYYKGFDRLIRVADRLQATVLIVGGGPLAGELEGLAGATSHAHLLKNVRDDELRDVLAAADVFVLPSINRAESFGISTLEAQAMGVPAVVTDVGTGTIEAIDNRHTGLVVTPNDEDALVAAIRRLLSDDALRSAMAVAARGRVRTSFSMEAIAEQFADLYSDVAGRT
ncbi:MAG: glycosyltransferase [Actinomycetota bacterium]|nr:glycosyltransferase [Actinomycetota bacterium]